MSKICPVCGTTYSDANAFCPADGTTLRAAEVTADLIGSVVADRYLVTDLLGEGGMGKVYLARHVRLPQQAAIKVLRHNMLKDAAAVARFTREAASASRIDHDRVARVYDFGETSDGTVYLAMEFVPGRSLKKLLSDTGPLEPRRAATLVRQIAEGMDAAHRLGIVHRDLKPDNVMVVEDGDGAERVKVVDFGIAKALGADEGGAGLTQAGYVVGTPEFMSPEQLLGGQIDARSDVYALAIIAYQCLTGSFPFDTTTPERVMAARLTEAPRTLAQAQPAMPWPDAVQAVLDAGLSRDVEGRPASAGTFARALAEAIEGWRPASPGMRPLVTPR
ncbi:serine/threonine-protein kinase, partial [Roseisolibacter sp. H3M3-2]|uniref:serine/threonine-protein kinase n=1 Tax=Roseisolibacter sp. H3M3-2 TaxID=3031323 RepID=UPI0023DAB435